MGYRTSWNKYHERNYEHALTNHRRSRRRAIRRLMYESLEKRELLVADWQNPLANLDANDDGFISPLDALVIINDINLNGSRALSTPFDNTSVNATYINVTGDESVSPLDVLTVINRLNLNPTTRAIDLQLQNDTGDFSNDNLTKDARVRGQIVPADAALTRIKARLNRGPIFDLTVDSTGNFTSDPTLVQSLTDGIVQLSISVNDASGLDGLRQLKFQLDRVAPTLTAPKIILADDTGIRDNDNITRLNRPRIEGKAEAGAKLKLDIAGAKLFDGIATGAFTKQTEALSDGAYELLARVSDVAGNVASSITPIVVDTLAPSSPSLNLSPTSDTGTLDDRITSNARVTLLGSTEGNSFLTVAGLGVTVRSSGDGTFRIPNISLNSGTNPFALNVSDLAGNTNNAQQSISRVDATASTDPVLRWNQAALESIRLDATTPPEATRGLAMVSIAMLDVVNAIERTPSYLVSLPAPTDVSTPAAISTAAFQVMNYLYPGQAAAIESVQANALSQIPDGPAKTQGIAFGALVGDAVIALRARDGWNTFIDYVPGAATGQWKETSPIYDVALLPQWGDVTPFAVDNVQALTPVAPPALSSQEYTDSLNEIKTLGRAIGSTRTPDQTQIARFWADGGGTYTPPGDWNQIAGQFASAQGLSVGENARLFAMLNVALGDAAIVS